MEPKKEYVFGYPSKDRDLLETTLNSIEYQVTSSDAINAIGSFG